MEEQGDHAAGRNVNQRTRHLCKEEATVIAMIRCSSVLLSIHRFTPSNVTPRKHAYLPDRAATTPTENNLPACSARR